MFYDVATSSLGFKLKHKKGGAIALGDSIRYEIYNKRQSHF